MSLTHALYQSRGDLRKYQTKIISICGLSGLQEQDKTLFKEASPEDVVVITDETIFHAQGGGQPTDIGSMILKDNDDTKGRLLVSSVRRGGDGFILHLGKFAPEPTPMWEVGTEIEQTIDSEKRDFHSRLHTGGHLLGLAVRQVIGNEIPNFAETKASHAPGSASIECTGLIEEKWRDAIQLRTDELVEQALPVRICWFNEQEIIDHRVVTDGGFKVGPEGTSRVVEIGDFGGYPCGGTHCTDTKLIGKVVIKKIARKKGNTKISYDVI